MKQHFKLTCLFWWDGFLQFVWMMPLWADPSTGRHSGLRCITPSALCLQATSTSSMPSYQRLLTSGRNTARGGTSSTWVPVQAFSRELRVASVPFRCSPGRVPTSICRSCSPRCSSRKSSPTSWPSTASSNLWNAAERRSDLKLCRPWMKWRPRESVNTHSTQHSTRLNTRLLRGKRKEMRLCALVLASAPSLASFSYLLGVFYKSSTGSLVLLCCDHCVHLSVSLFQLFPLLFPASSGSINTNILHDVMSELEGTSFTCQDPDDGRLSFCVN